MRLALLVLPMLLAGCLATPVKRNFPDVPDDMKVACPSLKEVDPTTTKLSDVITVVSENYGEANICRDKVDNWIEWYNTQKKIFDSVK
jgi:hypothetical protein